MFCPKCGATLPDNQAQCNYCGTHLAGGNINQNGAPYGGQTSSPYQTQNYNQQVNFYQAPAQTKKSKAKIIIPIAVGGGILLLLVVIFLVAVFSEPELPEPSVNPTVNTQVNAEPETVMPTDVPEETVVILDNTVKSYGYVMYRRVYAQNGLNIRAMPAKSSTAVTCIPNMAMVSVLGYSESQAGWLYVRYLGNEGWVDSQYLTEVSVANFRVIMSDGLNLRTEPSTSSNNTVILEIPYGDVVQFISYNGKATWAKVSYCGEVGWVSANYLQGTTDDATRYNYKSENESDYEYYEEYIVTMGDGLNLRTEPSTASDKTIILEIPYGATVQFFYTNTQDSDWSWVRYNGKEGWVSSKYISPVGYAPENHYYKITMEEGLNLRTEPSTDSDDTVICEIPYGEIVTFIEYNSDGSWAKVRYDGQDGWVSAKWIAYSHSY